MRPSSSVHKIGIKDFMLYSLIFSIVFLPSFRVLGYDLRVEELIVLAFLVGGGIWLLKHGELTIRHSTLVPLLLFFAVYILISLLTGLLSGLPPAFRDFMEFVKLVKYLVIFLAVLSLADTDKRRQKAVNLIIVLTCLTSLVGVTQYKNLFGLNEYYVPFVAPTQSHTLVGAYPYPRIVGFSANPNLYAVIAAIAVLLAANMFLKHWRLRYLLAAGINLVGVLLTQSRSGMAFLIVALAFLLAANFYHLPWMKSAKARRIIVFCLAGLLCFILFLQVAPASLTWRFKEGLDLRSSVTWLMRLERWESSLEMIEESPFLGWGPGKNLDVAWAYDNKNYEEQFVDNEWLFLTRRYGTLGTAYLVAVFLVPALFVPRREDTLFYRQVYFSILAGSAVYMIAGNIYHSLHVMSLVMVVAGLYFAAGSDTRFRLRLWRRERRAVQYESAGIV